MSLDKLELEKNPNSTSKFRSHENLIRISQKNNKTKKKSKFSLFFERLSYTWRKLVIKFIKLSTSLGLARFLSWIFFILIVIFSQFLSFFVGTENRDSFIESQESYTLLLAENLNKQIFRRFSLPVAYASGKVSLSDPDQYKLLDEIISSILHGLPVQKIRIFDSAELVSYSNDVEEVQRIDLTGEGVKFVFQNDQYIFEIDSEISYIQALFTPNLPPESFILKIFYPLTIDYDVGPFDLQRLEKEGEKTILGVLEINHDITSFYERAVRLQWSVFLGFIFSVTTLFVIILLIVRTAERIIRERISQNKRLEKELAQNEKLASMGRMVASIAHEVRNPLGIIKSSSEFLLSREINISEKKLIQAIFDETSRLSLTVNDFLDYARPRNPGNDGLDLTAIINKVWAFLGQSFEKRGISIELHLPEELPFYGDEDALYRAFYNIFINAEQAMLEQDKVEPWTFNVVGFMNRNGKITLRFIDNGCGFPSDFEKVLDPFFTTKETGTGLGLAITKNIIISHNGELRLYNHDDGGAVVEITFDSIIS